MHNTETNTIYGVSVVVTSVVNLVYSAHTQGDMMCKRKHKLIHVYMYCLFWEILTRTTSVVSDFLLVYDITRYVFSLEILLFQVL